MSLSNRWCIEGKEGLTYVGSGEGALLAHESIGV
jgi:hypothetical protein